VKFDRRRAFDLTRRNAVQQGSVAEPDKSQFRIEWDEEKQAPAAGTKPKPNDDDDFTIEWDE
jgi:hypothetical protein